MSEIFKYQAGTRTTELTVSDLDQDNEIEFEMVGEHGDLTVWLPHDEAWNLYLALTKVLGGRYNRAMER